MNARERVEALEKDRANALKADAMQGDLEKYEAALWSEADWLIGVARAAVEFRVAWHEYYNPDDRSPLTDTEKASVAASETAIPYLDRLSVTRARLMAAIDEEGGRG